MKTNLKLVFFTIYALVLLYIPYHLITTYEEVIETGKSYVFKIEFRDPSDIFRGDYLQLYFEASHFIHEPLTSLNKKKYLSLGIDDAGYAFIKDLSDDKPLNSDYLYVDVENFYNDSLNGMYSFSADFGFTKYFLPSELAKEAETLFNQSLLEKNNSVTAIVHVKNGYGVLDRLMINDQNLLDLIEH